ncbi:Ig-like domain repeat protein [Olivibacter sp. SDN3]|uniref:Ig-like domain repeat protein n=1 Tax=unclassified Olivibacter TaxID=2632301 RepID=UPI001651114E|nr:Ig-like domain repeat protein [Olivibacter sp. SDN3]QNL50280.1 Ig-like domain repeat protein [Olivibacter sp. SDN3]
MMNNKQTYKETHIPIFRFSFLLLLLTLSLGACKKTTVIEYYEAGNSNNPDDDGDSDKPIVDIQAGSIATNTTWSKDTVYRLNGFVRVGRDSRNTQNQPAIEGVILTIEPGTIVIGDRETKGTLIVQRGNKIMAEGTESEPIIFTSERSPGFREAGDWGGVVLCGKATNNQGEAELEGNYGAWHGGQDEEDNSGVLKYVRIEYAGIPINPNQEVNSLTMGSVGRGTTIEYVQCSYGLDDAFEWFGGSVNCKYLVAYRGLDDDFDVDYGYHGNVQFAIAIRDANSADQSGSNGFEVDNDGSGTDSSPFTSGTFSNITIIGPKKDKDKTISVQFQNALHLRRNNKLKIHNSIFTGFPNGLFIQGTNTAANAAAGELVMKNCILAGVEGWGENGYGTGGSVNFPNPKGEEIIAAQIGSQDASAWFRTEAFGNATYPKWTDLGIDPTIFDLSESPQLLPTTGSLLLSGASFHGLEGLETVEYRGAFGATNWTQGWANFTPQQAVYY